MIKAHYPDGAIENIDVKTFDAMKLTKYLRNAFTIGLAAILQFFANAAYSQTSIAAETAYRELAKSFLEKLDEARSTGDYKAVTQIADGLNKSFPDARTIHQRMNCHLAAAKFPTPNMQINAQKIKQIDFKELEKIEEICFEGLNNDTTTGKNYPSGNYYKVIRLICMVSDERCKVLKEKRVDPPSQEFGGFAGAFDFTYASADDGMVLTDDESERLAAISKITRPLRTNANKALTEKKYTEAIELYSNLIQLNPYQANYFGSRATAKWKLKDYTGAIADFDSATLLEPKNGDWPLKRSWVRYSAGDYRGSDEDVKIATNIDRDAARYIIDSKVNFNSNSKQRFLKSVAAKSNPVRMHQKEWEDNSIVGYWFRYEYIDYDSKVKVRVPALSYRLNAFSDVSLEICDLAQNSPCRKQNIIDCHAEDGCQDISRRILFTSPILKIFSDINLEKVLVTVPLQFQQWDTDGPKKNVKVYQPGLSGALNGPYRPDVVVVHIDPTFTHEHVERIIAIERFSNKYGVIEPVYGYLEKSRILNKTTYVDDPLSVEATIQKLAHPKFLSMPQVQSPYNSIDKKLDPRRVLTPNRGTLFGGYGFVHFFSSGARCSGTIVGNALTVVTAGHCLLGNTDFDVIYTTSDGREIKRKARLVQSPFENRVKLASQFGLHPNQQGTLYTSTDWAILKLESKFSDEITPLPLADLGKSLSLNNRSLTYIIGFPGDLPTTIPTVSACLSSHRNSIDTSISWSANSNFVASVTIGSCVTYNGNSGSAAVVLENNQPKFLGVLSGGGSADFVSNCPEYNYSENSFNKEGGLKKIALKLMDDRDVQLLEKATGKGYWSLPFSEIQKHLPTVASKAQRVIALSTTLPTKNIEIGTSGNNEEKRNCQSKDYAAPFRNENLAVLGISTWLFKDIQSLSSTKYELTPVAGITHLANPVNGFLLHTDIREWLPTIAACLRYEPRLPFVVGQSVNLSSDSTCEVPAALIEQSSNLPPAHGLAAAVISGSLVLYNKTNRSIVSGYEGVIERCAVDPDYFCRLHDVINLPK